MSDKVTKTDLLEAFRAQCHQVRILLRLINNLKLLNWQIEKEAFPPFSDKKSRLELTNLWKEWTNQLVWYGLSPFSATMLLNLLS